MVVISSSCEKEKRLETKEETSQLDDSVATEITDDPVIELVSVTPTTVTQFEDAIVFTISYTDGNGDIGNSDADNTSLELVDNRDPSNLVESFHIPPVTPAGTTIMIQGTLEVFLDRTAILNDDNSSETTTFSIRLRDRAGTWSNTVTTGTITINQ